MSHAQADSRHAHLSHSAHGPICIGVNTDVHALLSLFREVSTVVLRSSVPQQR